METAEANRDWRKADDLLDRAQKANPNNIATIITRAEILAAKGKTQDAREQLEDLCKNNPKSPEVWTARVHLERNSKGVDAARTVLEVAARELGNDLSIHLMSILLAAQRKPEQAIKDVEEATKDLEKLPPEQAARVWSLAATLYLHLKQERLARLAAAQVVALRPDNLQNQLLQFEATVHCGDDDSARAAVAAIDEIRQLEGPSGGIACYCDALRLILRASKAKERKEEPNKAEMEHARDLLIDAAARRPGWPKVALLWAQWYELEGHHDQAIVRYRDAFEQGERSFEVVLALIKAFLANGQFQAALGLIERLDKESTSRQEQRMFAEVYLYSANYPRALEAALKANLVESPDANDHLMLGVLYAAAKNEAKAEEEFAKACDLAETPEPWVARVQFVLSNKGKDKAEAVLKGLEFRKKVSDALVKLDVCEVYRDPQSRSQDGSSLRSGPWGCSELSRTP